MKYLRLGIAGFLILCILPAWRAADWAIILWPEKFAFGLLIALGLNLFLILPLKLINPSLSNRLLGFFILFSLIPLIMNPLSLKSSTDPTYSHCGYASYTGAFYPLKEYLPAVQSFDLDIRNQFCWIRKMIRHVPVNFDTQDEFLFYKGLIKTKLQRPERKYKVSLVGIYFLWSAIHDVSRPGGPLDKISNKKDYVYDMIDWYSMYDYEVTQMDFKWHDWPYSELLKLEYGWFEKNVTLQSQP